MAYILVSVATILVQQITGLIKINKKFMNHKMHVECYFC